MDLLSARKKDNIFIIKRSEITGRLDPHYNQPLFSKLWDKLYLISGELTTLRKNSICIFSGITPKSGGDAYTLNDGVPFVRSGDFSEMNEIDFSKLLRLKREIHDGIMCGSQLQKNDLLIAIVGATIGKVGVYQYDIEANINQAICAIRLKNTLNPYYVQAFFQTYIGQKIIERIKRPVARANINLEEVGNLPIPLLDLHKQNEIAQIMDDSRLQKQAKEREANALLASIDDYLLSELGIERPTIARTENGRFIYTSIKEIEGKRIDPYYNHPYFKKAYNSLHKTPYPVLRLGQLSTLIASGSTPPSGGEDYTTKENGIMFVRSGDITNDCNIIDSSDMLYITKECHNTKMRQSQLRYGDILIAIVGATIGAVNIYNYNAEANINQAIALVRLKSGINELFITEQLRSSIGRLNLEHQKRPVARANINLDEIAQMELILPPLEIQDKIAENIQSIRDQAKYLQQEAKEIINNAKQKIEQMILGK